MAHGIAHVLCLEFLLRIRFSIRLYKIHWGNNTESNENVQCNTPNSTITTHTHTAAAAVAVNHQSDDLKFDVILAI